MDGFAVPTCIADAADQLAPFLEEHWSLIAKYTESGTGGILPHAGLISVYRLLMGLAIENALKACLVREKLIDVSDGIFPAELKTHDLSALAKKLGLTLSRNQLIHVESLTLYVDWAGRYPIPVSLEKWEPPWASSEDVKYSKELFDLVRARAVAS